jgi:hypothetical protein
MVVLRQTKGGTYPLPRALPRRQQSLSSRRAITHRRQLSQLLAVKVMETVSWYWTGPGLPTVPNLTYSSASGVCVIIHQHRVAGHHRRSPRIRQLVMTNVHVLFRMSSMIILMWVDQSQARSSRSQRQCPLPVARRSSTRRPRL